jgi:hypothetical protein
MIHETLSKFGTSFQAKSLAALIKDIGFLEQVYDIVEPDYFDTDSMQWVAETTVRYYQRYRFQPTIEVFKTELAKEDLDDATLGTRKQALKSIYEEFDATDMTYIKEQFLDFCKNQSLKNAIMESADLLNQGDYPRIKAVIDRALHAGEERDFGHDWKLDVDARLLKSSRDTIATPWKQINQVMDGGLGAAELGTIMAPAGAGKSWVLSAIGLHAMLLGKKVVHFTFELSERYVGNRYDSIAIQVEPNKVGEN